MAAGLVNKRAGAPCAHTSLHKPSNNLPYNFPCLLTQVGAGGRIRHLAAEAPQVQAGAARAAGRNEQPAQWGMGSTRHGRPAGCRHEKTPPASAQRTTQPSPRTGDRARGWGSSPQTCPSAAARVARASAGGGRPAGAAAARTRRPAPRCCCWDPPPRLHCEPAPRCRNGTAARGLAALLLLLPLLLPLPLPLLQSPAASPSLALPLSRRPDPAQAPLPPGPQWLAAPPHWPQ